MCKALLLVVRSVPSLRGEQQNRHSVSQCLLRTSLETGFVIAGEALVKNKGSILSLMWRRLVTSVHEIILNPSDVALVSLLHLQLSYLLLHLANQLFVIQWIVFALHIQWLRKWIKKCDDDSETSNWIAANTKVSGVGWSEVSLFSAVSCDYIGSRWFCYCAAGMSQMPCNHREGWRL